MPYNRLTPKQERFAELYVFTGNASQAYRMVYNVRPNTKPKTVWESASKLLKNPKVAARIAEILDSNRERKFDAVEASRNELVDKLKEVAEMAYEKKRPATMVRALHQIALLCGLYPDNK